ncbi:EAL domain-containing protein [Vibrio navarrensis]|nr:EAL domain-containing protein [Vibrio navarrensis]
MQTFSLWADDLEQLQEQIQGYDWQVDSPYLIQLFSAQSASVTEAYARSLRMKLPRAEIIGHSTRNMIHAGEILHHGCLIVISQFTHTQLTSAVQPYSGAPDLDSYDFRHALNLSPASCAVVSFAVQVQRVDYPIYSAFRCEEACPPVAGGLAQATEDGCWVLHQEKVYHNAAVAVALHGDALKVWTHAYSEWNPVGMYHKVTAAQGRRLIALGNKSAYDVYKHYLADNRDISLNQLINFPLYREVNNKKEVCSVCDIHADGSMTFDRDWQVGDEVRFCYNHPSLTLEQLKHGVMELAMHQPESVFIYNCASRLDFIDGAEEVSAFNELATTNGSYCMGEIYSEGASLEILHHSLTYLALRESDEVTRFNLPSNEISSSISPLFCLIRSAIADLDNMNAHMEYQLERQAMRLQESYRRDSRTGLPNRIALKEYLNDIQADEHLLTLKLLNFNHINEKYGYQVGDELLQMLSVHFTTRLRKRLGKGANLRIYSIGVGEWAFIFRAGLCGETIKQLFTRFADLIEQTNFEPSGLEHVDYLSISLCGGLASRRDFPNASGDELLLKAIEARRVGVRNNTHICDAKEVQVSEEVRREQLGWLGCVSRAILQQNIVTYAQPIFHADGKTPSAKECLVRIVENDGRIVLPGQFLPIITGTHLYTRLSRHMIQSTLDYMRDKQEAFSINLSPQDLLSDRTLLLLEASINQLNDPSRIGLEVLESEQIKDYGRMIEVCSHFRRLGARIIVDDFGSGYSNIDEIIKLEPEIIKLDGSLIRNIDQDEKQRKIANQLVRLCQVLNAKTVAEFVHNQQVCQIVQDMGVDYLQGYFLGEPQRLF